MAAAAISPHCADFAAGLAFTGCRVGESREIAWRDVDFDAGEIVVRGDAETGTKNWELRRVPLIPDARALFERMRGERPGEPLDAKVFRVRRMPEGARSRLQKGRRGSHHASRLAAFVCDALHRKRRGYSDCFPLARTQRRRCAGNENLRAFAARAQHCASAARELRAGSDKAGRCDSISCHGIAVRSVNRERRLWQLRPKRRGGCPMPRTRIEPDPLGCRKISEQKRA